MPLTITSTPGLLAGITVVLAGFGTWPALSRLSGADALTSSVLITVINLPAFYACQALWSTRGSVTSPREALLLVVAGSLTVAALWPRLSSMTVLQAAALVLAGLLGGVGRFKYVELSGNTDLPMSVIMPVLQAGPMVVTALVALWLAGEPISVNKAVSMSVILIGCIALSLSSVKPVAAARASLTFAVQGTGK